ncbi:NAD-dependent epimerase/dehydratase family protein [Leptolyngbya sp. 15MV]|nr:NAD-dependent epimerase/dehydratase family protein [Leptolyngbya sp. 15MV]
MTDLTSKKIILTGGAGFLGRHIIERLKARGVPERSIFVPRRRDYDLTEARDCQRLLREAFPGAKADLIIHAAAEVGGIGANRANPGRYFYANMAMALHLIEQARLDGLVDRGGKFVQIGTICAYPNLTPVPFSEDNLWNGYPEVTNAPYGVAKKAAWQMLEAYRLQYGLRSAYVLPVNLYGPWDNFDLSSSHVIPALVRKCLEARQRDDRAITCGGTGSASREFLYVDDCAEAVVLAAERVDDPQPINLGSGREITIKLLLGELAWDLDLDGDDEITPPA